MKALWLSLALILAGGFAGCISVNAPLDADSTPPAKDLAENTTHALPDVINGLQHLAGTDVPVGNGIWVHGDHAYVSGSSTGFHVVDIRNPEKPTVVGELTGNFYSRDVDFLTYNDGRLVAVTASQGGGVAFVNVTDPTNPAVLSTVEPGDMDGSPGHNVAVLPGTHLVYNSASDGKGGDIDVIDAADPENPKVLGNWGTHGCHDLTFYMNETEEKYRAYCAGIEETQIWDITDPLNGKLVSSFTNPFISLVGHVLGQDGSLTPGLHHLAMVNEDASLLIVGDEYLGGLGAGCGKHVPGAPDTPLGAVWFYDISDETHPKELGHVSPDFPVANNAETQSVSCTAHFGSLLPGKDMIAMAWYTAGVVLIDFSDPSEPVIVDQWNEGTDTWDVRYHNGHLYTGDMARGLDVLTFL